MYLQAEYSEVFKGNDNSSSRASGLAKVIVYEQALELSVNIDQLFCLCLLAALSQLATS